ncbi:MULTISPECIES: DNA translocase FtsK [unclassified Arsukibacterium]|uniref:DNA translocase FtsK n=1 Tax=unclassified Arsukibacterium TaxID=2635278 RepID=UPI000C3CF72D|nr:MULTISPECIES: DNA translocase FtsK [unclassified Arsukibacterium]MAA95995.1 cell division protein FtsK [Rheinheimera sp.]MBM33432.1 cell division protein FtsK [Rheinheimera sp.]HAW91835.1 cell division protein FtsK [Candidatus Azambacteria bacterium]
MQSKQLFPLNGVQRLLEVGLILFWALALFLLLALFSFDPADPSWSQTGYQTNVNNFAGLIGARVADILLFCFGWVSYLMPFLIAAFGYLLFKRYHDVFALDYLILGLRLIGIVLTLVCATAISSMNFDDIYYFSSGGAVGDVTTSILLPYFNFIGTSLLLLAGFTTGLTLMTGISWLTVADYLGMACFKAGQWLALLPGWLSERFGSAPPDTDDADVVEPAPLQLNHAQHKSAIERSEAALFGESKVTGPLPVKPLNPKTEAKSYYSLDQLADEQLSFSAVDEPMNAEHISKTLAQLEPQESLDPLMQYPEEEEDADDSEEVQHTMEELPSLALLDRPDKAQNPIDPADLERVSRLVEAKLLDFNVEARVVGVHPGPVVTRFELDLAPGVKVSKITGLAKDLARSLSAISVRVVEVIPGKSFIGLELPNQHREIVRLSEVIGDEVFTESKSALTMVLGKDIAGKSVVADLAKMPHLLVAGTTGSGKSVGVNVMICSLLYKSTPDDVRFLMIDPKMLELSIYEGIPHLLTEVVTDMKDAANGLRWCVGEMERRYKLMSALGVRNLKGYNLKVKEAIAAGEPLKDPLWKPSDDMRTEVPLLEKLPAIVVVIDEFADMMMIVGKKVEELIARIAQKARAAGIHLILATQRPSVDVITGLIKANIPTRIAFQVSSKIDSRTILDQQGAESLLGQGDMLYLPPGSGVPNRVHGAFVDDHEVHAVVADWKKRGKPNYISEILSGETSEESLLPGETMEGDDGEADPLYDQAVAHVIESRRASVSGVQRKFRIGYNRAARLVEQMEMSGVVSGPGHNGNREVMVPAQPKGY